MARAWHLRLFVLACLWLGAGRSAAAAEHEYRAELLTVGPGDALLTRAGHAAVVVVDRWPDGREFSTVYNYGDADFGDPWLGLKFAFGQPRFYLSVVGDLYAAVEFYGLNQNRDVWVQPLSLTSAQAQALAERLELQAQPEHREYDYHYLEHTCTTELRAVLDAQLGGAIETQLSAETDPWTIRTYQQLVFDGDWVMPLLADAGFGRRHDEAITKYYATMWPGRLREYLQEVRVPDPNGGDGLVPLAGAPELVAERGGAPATEVPTQLTWYVAGIGGALFLLGGLWLRSRAPSRLAGVWLLAWAVPVGVVGLVITVLALASAVPETHDNELVLSLLATDLGLVPTGVRWLRGRTTVPTWLPRYAVIRLVVVGAAVAARATGVFIQEPWIVPVASLAFGIGLWRVTSGLAATREPEEAT
jgi:hypothetical protein